MGYVLNTANVITVILAAFTQTKSTNLYGSGTLLKKKQVTTATVVFLQQNLSKKSET